MSSSEFLTQTHTVSPDTFRKLALITKKQPIHAKIVAARYQEPLHSLLLMPLSAQLSASKAEAIKHLLQISHSDPRAFHNYRPVSNFIVEKESSQSVNCRLEPSGLWAFITAPAPVSAASTCNSNPSNYK